LVEFWQRAALSWQSSYLIITSYVAFPTLIPNFFQFL
jgi:hypothetical protein